MAPLVVQELLSGGLREEQIKFLAAVGSHRYMTAEEKVRKLGKEIEERFEVLDHTWDKAESLLSMGATQDGLEIVVNRLVGEADLLVALGQVSPHRVAGFSGGAKIVLPGVCGEQTVGQTHWLSTFYPPEEVFGVPDNPIRKRMDEVASVVGLDFILNVVLDEEGRVVGAVAGDYIAAHRSAAQISLDVNVVHLDREADIVLADSRPGDRDFWQAAKAFSMCKFCVRPGGTIILVTPCAEGISAEHPEVEKHGYVGLEEVSRWVEQGRFSDLAAAAHIRNACRVLEHAHCAIVSPGIGPKRGREVNLPVVLSPQEALWGAFQRHGADASVAILEHAADTFPIVGSGAGREQKSPGLCGQG
jgi:nickel-dependent lactate racemase